MAEETKQTDVLETKVEEVKKEVKKEQDPTVDEGAELLKQIKDLRKESANYRTGKKEIETELADLKDKLAKSLGLKEDETDTNKLSDELTQLQGKYRQERLKNAFYRVGQKYEADTDLTWAKLFTDGALADIDVDAEDFEAKLDELIKTTVANNPKLKNSFKSSDGANPPPDPKRTVKDEYNETKAELRKNPNDQMLTQKLFILKSQLKE